MLPKYMERYTKDPIFKYIVNTMIMKNCKKRVEKYMWEIHVGNSARRLPKATAGPTRAALSP